MSSDIVDSRADLTDHFPFIAYLSFHNSVSALKGNETHGAFFANRNYLAYDVNVICQPITRQQSKVAVSRGRVRSWIYGLSSVIVTII